MLELLQSPKLKRRYCDEKDNPSLRRIGMLRFDADMTDMIGQVMTMARSGCSDNQCGLLISMIMMRREVKKALSRFGMSHHHDLHSHIWMIYDLCTG